MSDEIGSVMMDVEEELVMPDIPVRANQSIPTVTAIILLIGAMMVGYAAYSSFVSDELFSEADEAQLAEQFTDNQADVTQEDLHQYDEQFSNSTYGKWSGLLFATSALCLLGGGILLFRGDRRGIHSGLLGALILTITNLWGSSASGDAAMHLPEIASMTLVTMYYIYACCGLFCMTLAVMPMLFASGRAALTSPSTILSITSASEEE